MPLSSSSILSPAASAGSSVSESSGSAGVRSGGGSMSIIPAHGDPEQELTEGVTDASEEALQ
eukprot:CAMPEP_0180538850 /NCGR_PEP_ID=MMETSP1036_2-20121128/66578_1 /TAXON_ID=632150 /ORGANISM="Azadinium spinosum, Strain 3D9" /LENGTH=61 /DNA_ID=CAMNT_0022553557 /DNA_START=6 /DNA_END=191 /DNA_ORIENTATION=+